MGIRKIKKVARIRVIHKVARRICHIVALSGGKDSTALALALAECEPREYQYVITPTGDELPPMKEHLVRLSGLLGRPLIVAGPGLTLQQLCETNRALPNWRMRFCTRSLKIIPFQQYALERCPATIYVGLRADEMGRSGVEWDGDLVCRYPLREWGWDKAAVLAYLRKRGVTIPRRTDCARCFYQTLGEWYDLWREYPGIYADAVAQEDRFGHTFRSPQRDTWPADLRGLGGRFAAGDVPRRRTRGEGCRVCSM